MPYAFRAFGMSVASRLASRLIQILLTVNGMDKEKISFKFEIRLPETEGIFF